MSDEPQTLIDAMREVENAMRCFWETLVRVLRLEVMVDALIRTGRLIRARFGKMR